MADRISDLPDSLLLHILSFLPTKLAATTTILSKRYKSLYLQLLTLHFDDQTFQHFNSFTKFIAITFTSRDTTLPIHSFTFKSRYKNSKPLNRILNLIFKNSRIENLKNLKFLTIVSHESLIVELPPPVFSCTKNLQVLQLKKIIIRDFDFDFPVLKTLRWNGVYFENRKCLVKLISSCRVLDKLVAYNTHFSAEDGEEDLEDKFKAFPNLVTARIFDYFVPITLFSEIQILHLGMQDMVWTSCTKLPLFHRLTYINITHVSLEENLMWLLELLKHCPKLQNFTIQDRLDPYDNEKVAEYWKDPPIVPQCLSSQLKTFSLKGYQGKTSEFQFVTYIMQNSKVLQTMTIKSTRFANTYAKKQMLMKLSSSTMGSTTCKVLFY